ncbi:MAG: choice-of-anchor D domain-containing protein [Archangiaceae bacterium]|nr:choice-of-anchor D domain-containing protein [Archangiaceae bacterium]
MAFVALTVGCTCGGGTTRVRPEIEVQPGSIDFGTVALGGSTTRKVTVFSRGTVALTIQSASVQGDAAFTASGPAMRNLSPSTSTEVEVTFRPGTLGPRSARLIITSDAVNAPEVLVSLVGDSLPSGTGGGSAGGMAGGSAGGVAGGTAGGSAGGSAGGTAGGTGGGSAGGSAGGMAGSAGGSAGGTAGGSGGGSAGGTSVDSGIDAGADAGIDAGIGGADAGVDAGCSLLLCGRAHAGVTCAVATQGTIGPFGGTWATSLFNDATGWNTVSTGRTVTFGDVDGDGRGDACGRGTLGVNCALNSGTTFGAMQLWAPEFSDAIGWGAAARYYSTIQLADPNGDGRKDVCGRSDAGVVCALGDAGVWRSTSFNDATSWGDPRYFANVQFVDVTGDGKADACGRGIFGISCSSSTGSGFGVYTSWTTEFSDALSWGTNAALYQTVHFPDVNGDGKADVCGRGTLGIICALSDGTRFLSSSQWSTDFSDAAGWTQRSQFSTIQFPDLDGDGKADVCGRAAAGLLCAMSDGTHFVSPTATQLFSDATGWGASPSTSVTIQFADLDGDGQLDVCGRGTVGVFCALRQQGTFGSLFLTQALATDTNGWADDTVYPTLRFVSNGPRSCRLGPSATPAARVGP